MISSLLIFFVVSSSHAEMLDLELDLDLGATVHESSQYKLIESQDEFNDRGNLAGFGLSSRLMLYGMLGLEVSGVLHSQGTSVLGAGPAINIEIQNFKLSGYYGLGTATFVSSERRSDTISYKAEAYSIFLGYRVEDIDNETGWLGVKFSQISNIDSKVIGSVPSGGFFQRISVSLRAEFDIL